MAKQKEEKITVQDLAKKNLGLESYFNNAGINSIRKDNGEFYCNSIKSSVGDSEIDLLGSSEVAELRKELRNSQVEEAKQNGYEGRVSGPNDDDLLYKIFNVTRQSLNIINFGNLEKIAKDKGAKLKTKVPTELRNLSKESIIKKAVESGAIDKEGKLDMKKLDKTSQAGLAMYQSLSQAYDTAASEKINEKRDVYAGINESMDAIAKEYASSE